jgi:RNA polymerase sigma factor (sigma-70 family)
MSGAPGESLDPDLTMAERCIRGDADAHCELRRAYYDVVCRVLMSRGASETEAADVAGDLFSDCIVRTTNGESLLGRYGGRCSLKSWLITVATNRLIDAKRRSRFRRQLGNGQEEAQVDDSVEPLAGDYSNEPNDSALIRLLRVSLRKGIDACEKEDYVMLCLVYLHGVTQREVAELWGWHESKVSRTLSRALKTIATVTMESVRIADPELELSWDDFVELAAAAPDVFRPGKFLQDDEVKSS